MPNKHPKMKLFHDEEVFLRHWIYEEVHFRAGPGRAKGLQLAHHVVSADLAVLIAAAIPDIADQEAAGMQPPAGVPVWPWSGDSFRARVEEARSLLAEGAVKRRQVIEHRS